MVFVTGMRQSTTTCSGHCCNGHRCQNNVFFRRDAINHRLLAGERPILVSPPSVQNIPFNKKFGDRLRIFVFCTSPLPAQQFSTRRRGPDNDIFCHAVSVFAGMDDPQARRVRRLEGGAHSSVWFGIRRLARLALRRAANLTVFLPQHLNLFFF